MFIDSLIPFSLSLIIFKFIERKIFRNYKVTHKYTWKNFTFLILIPIYLTNYFLFKITFPINKNHDVNFNNERVKIGIPILNSHWKHCKGTSDQFHICWSNLASTSKHFRKEIEYNLWSIKFEIDYYKIKKEQSIYVWSKYNYLLKEFSFYLEDVTNSVKKQITRKEFEEYISKE